MRRLSPSRFPARATSGISLSATCLHFDVDGREYVYDVREEPVTGYAASYQDGVIVNTRETPVPGASPSPTPLVTPIPNVTPRPDNPIALMYSDGEWIYLDEYGIPLGTLPVPKTGDESDLLLYAGVGLLLLFWCGRDGLCALSPPQACLTRKKQGNLRIALFWLRGKRHEAKTTVYNRGKADDSGDGAVSGGGLRDGRTLFPRDEGEQRGGEGADSAWNSPRLATAGADCAA